MRSDEALDRLDEMIAAAGVHRDAPTVEDVARVWAVLRALAKERVDDADPVQDDGDMLLAQYAIRTAWKNDPEVFDLDITRQFMFSPGGEYDHMAQLHCSFSFVPTPENRAVGETNMWGAPEDAFFEKAMQMPGFRLRERPIKLETGYSDV